MTEAAIPAPTVGASSWMHSIRLALVALAITVVLVHVSNLLRKLDVANRVEAGRVGQMHLS